MKTKTPADKKKAADAEPILAHIRHRLTRYEDHLIQGRSREESRQLVAAHIESLADSWRRPSP
jgi:hypothetical protein